MLFDLSEFRQPLPPNVSAFASGANRLTEIRGFSQLNIPIGVSVVELSDEAITLLSSLDRPVLIDSGAFGEVTFPNGIPTVVAPITDADWQSRLAKYLRLASALKSNAMIIVPDQVGNQTETLHRLTRYRNQIAQIAATSAIMLLPLQVGKVSHLEFYREAEKAAAIPLTPAMPMKKAATSPEDLVEFVQSVQPPHLHLLGIGAENRRTPKIIRLIETYSPDTRITLDSNRIRAKTGQGRPLTTQETNLRTSEIDGLYGAVESEVLAATGSGLDYTDAIAFASEWADESMLKAIALEAGFTAEQARRFLSDPDEFLQSPWDDCDEMAWIENPFVAVAMDRAWERFVHQTVRSSVRTAAILSVFRSAA
ncbi:MAG TPA: hypothetical protein VE866_16905 [Candidatus Binatia bacterium]|nr:hypothetical protein [Candidatus Binatia bacterium]